MTRFLLPSLSLCCVVAIGATAYAMLGSDVADRIHVPTKTASLATPPDDESELYAARRACSKAALDVLIDKFETTIARHPDDRHALHLLAEALLDRVMQRNQLRGIVVGSPIYDDLPADVAHDLDAGIAAVSRARELGDDSAELFRLEAGLMSYRITGLGTALQWNGKIQQALAAAGERNQDDPRLHVALGLRKLLAPKLLGQDIGKALEHFEFAAKALVDDERPAVFAAMANYLQQKRQQAIGWLEQAVQRNPQNVFAKIVLARCKRGEQDPFGRDVTAAEAKSAR